MVCLFYLPVILIKRGRALGPLVTAGATCAVAGERRTATGKRIGVIQVSVSRPRTALFSRSVTVTDALTSLLVQARLPSRLITTPLGMLLVLKRAKFESAPISSASLNRLARTT